jgi:ABC-type polysaccharide/polyol phosphate export permease
VDTAALLIPPAYVDLAPPRAQGGAARTWSLVRHLTGRHLADRYRGSALGFAWTLLNPLLMMLVYTFVFRHVLRLSVEDVPYTCFVLANYLAWGLFSRAAMQAGSSVFEGAHLLRRAHFDHLALPLSAALAHAVHLLAALPVLVLFNAALGVWPGPQFALIALALPLLMCQALVLGLVLAAIAPRFRDALQLAEVLLTAWFFLSPVVYPLALVARELPAELAWLYELNPLVGSLALMQTACLQAPVAVRPLLISICVTAAALPLALLLFRRRMRDVAELL